MKKQVAAAALFCSAVLLKAHVTPNVELVKKGEFVKQSLAGAARFFERELPKAGPEKDAIRKATGWAPSEEDTKLYIGRDAAGKLAGSVVLLWMSSQHGPLCLGIAFDPVGAIRRVAVTDVAIEALAWVRPILERDGMKAFLGLRLSSTPDPARVAPGAAGSMSRYYAKVIAEAVGRAQSIARLALEKDRS